VQNKRTAKTNTHLHQRWLCKVEAFFLVSAHEVTKDEEYLQEINNETLLEVLDACLLAKFIFNKRHENIAVHVFF